MTTSALLAPVFDPTASPSKRVVITGLGVVSPLGNTANLLIEALRRGESGIRPLTRLPHDTLPINHGAEAIAFTGDIEDYGPMDKTLQRTIRKSTKVMCREIEMGVASAQLALHNAGFAPDKFDRDRIGVLYGCDYIMSLPEEYSEGIAACTTDGVFDFGKWGQLGLPKVNPLWLLKYLPNMPASHVAIFNDLRGPNNSITLREASAGAAIAEAVSTIVRGHADALVVGSTGSRVHALRTLHAATQERLAANREDPATMSRPFDQSRDGSVVGEGAGAMLLESLEHATNRGANILGEVVSAATAMGGSSAEPFRTAIANVLRATLRSAGGQPVAVGHVHANGLADLQTDAEEAAAIVDVFGDIDSQPPVTTAKGHFGNLGAGGGMVEMIASLMSLGGSLFPIRNLQNLDGQCPINAVRDNSTPAGNSFISLSVTPQGQAAAVWMQSAMS